MKYFKMIAAIAAAALLTISCSKDETGLTGSYTYKTSGTLVLTPVGANSPTMVALYPEQGQMHVLKDGDKTIVTFNDLLGNADVTSATIKNDTLTLAGTDTKAAQLTDGTDKIGSGIVVYGGSGKLIEDMLILTLDYQGQFTVSGVPMTVVSSNVKCVAQHN